VWYPARQAAGIDATPHEFRHSAISHLRAAGIDPADLAAMSGPTVETATKHYTHALGRSFDAARKTIAGSLEVPSRSHSDRTWLCNGVVQRTHNPLERPQDPPTAAG
jgi:hypothetical protein